MQAVHVFFVQAFAQFPQGLAHCECHCGNALPGDTLTERPDLLQALWFLLFVEVTDAKNHPTEDTVLGGFVEESPTPHTASEVLVGGAVMPRLQNYN